MSDAVVRSPALANPWIGVGGGFLVCLLSGLASFTPLSATPVQVGAALLGLTLVALGLTIRLNSAIPPAANRLPLPPSVFYAALTLFQAAGALFVTWALIAATIGIDPIAPTRDTAENPVVLRMGLAVILWLLLVPLAIAGLRATLKAMAANEALTIPFETSVLYILAAGATLTSGFALAQCDSSLVIFLGALTALLSALVPLTIVSTTFRRSIVSAVIVLHFAAIVNATLAAHPASWLMGQLWTRFSRPYLEFMYLNNAYHFYSPDPGPASYLWFRIFYDTGAVDPETGEPKLLGRWLKIPDVDEKGNHGYRVALEYQRYLSLTEQVIAAEAAPPLYFRGPDGKMAPTPAFASRILNSPDGEILKKEWKGEVLGKDPPVLPKFVLSVPFHQFIANDQQYQKPTMAAHRMYEAYVQHVARTKHPTRDLPVHSVKVYRVMHMIPPWNVYAAGMDPADPEFYRPYYMGEYLPSGKLKEIDEPLRYWLLPILRDNQSLPASPIRSYAAMHAGDPNCVYLPTEKKWTDLKEGKR